MNNNDQLINAIIDLSQEIKGMRKDMNNQLGELNHKVEGLNHRVEKLEEQQAKTNLALGEMRLSYMKVAEQLNGLRSDFNKYASANSIKLNGHEKRINKTSTSQTF